MRKLTRKEKIAQKEIRDAYIEECKQEFIKEARMKAMDRKNKKLEEVQ